MSVLVSKETASSCRGSRREGTFHARGCAEYGTKVVGGVTPGKAGRSTRAGRSSIRASGRGEDRRECDGDFVPPPFAADAILEANDAGVPLIICITEGIPITTW